MREILRRVAGVDDEEVLLRAEPVDQEIVDEGSRRSQHRGVLASPVFENGNVVAGEPLKKGEGVRALDREFAHVRNVEQARAFPDGPVFVADSPVFDGHFPSAEIDHLRAELSVHGIQRRSLQTGCRFRRHRRRKITSRPPASQTALIRIAESDMPGPPDFSERLQRAARAAEKARLTAEADDLYRLGFEIDHYIRANGFPGRDASLARIARASKNPVAAGGARRAGRRSPSSRHSSPRGRPSGRGSPGAGPLPEREPFRRGGRLLARKAEFSGAPAARGPERLSRRGMALPRAGRSGAAAAPRDRRAAEPVARAARRRDTRSVGAPVAGGDRVRQRLSGGETRAANRRGGPGRRRARAARRGDRPRRAFEIALEPGRSRRSSARGDRRNRGNAPVSRGRARLSGAGPRGRVLPRPRREECNSSGSRRSALSPSAKRRPGNSSASPKLFSPPGGSRKRSRPWTRSCFRSPRTRFSTGRVPRPSRRGSCAIWAARSGASTRCSRPSSRPPPPPTRSPLPRKPARRKSRLTKKRACFRGRGSRPKTSCCSPRSARNRPLPKAR